MGISLRLIWVAHRHRVHELLEVAIVSRFPDALEFPVVGLSIESTQNHGYLSAKRRVIGDIEFGQHIIDPLRSAFVQANVRVGNIFEILLIEGVENEYHVVDVRWDPREIDGDYLVI